MKVRSPTAVLLHRARVVFMLTALIPTALLSVVGVVLLATRESRSAPVVAGVLVLCFCATALVGYTLGTIFVTRGASLATVQNEFLASLSHELRTPLTSIRMFIDTLREERVHDPVEKQRCLTVIHQELTRLDGLVGKLFTLSKIESRHAAFDRQIIPLEPIINEALVAFEAMKFGSSVDLEVKIEPGLMVQGDQSALAQAVANLLGNAWKYTRPDDKKIELAVVGDPTHVSIIVTDNGVGIPESEHELIFEKFQRGAAALNSDRAGTGLGLPIVRAIVKAHRGKIDVRSQADQGARFRIVLPRRDPDPQ